MMSLLQLPVLHESWFLAFALLFSAMLGIRGIFIQIHDVKNENIGCRSRG